MGEKYQVGHFCFQDRDVYERALKEQDIINAVRKKYKVSNGKTALKLYQKAIEENAFSTVVGYCFLRELRAVIRKTGVAQEEELADILVPKEVGKETEGSPPSHKTVIGSGKEKGERYRVLYDGQRILNRRLKIVVVALVVLVIAFLVIEVKSQYSVFTYFTDYKTEMEEELINKYEKWENELRARESTLEQQE